jgi:hypothetical protein
MILRIVLSTLVLCRSDPSLILTAPTNSRISLGRLFDYLLPRIPNSVFVHTGTSKRKWQEESSTTTTE